MDLGILYTKRGGWKNVQIYKKAFLARMTECLEKKNLELV